VGAIKIGVSQESAACWPGQRGKGDAREASGETAVVHGRRPAQEAGCFAVSRLTQTLGHPASGNQESTKGL